MVSYRLSPYVHFIESHLVPNHTQYAVFHQLTGEVFELLEPARALLLAAKSGSRLSFAEQDLRGLAEVGAKIRQLIAKEFLVPSDYDALSSFENHYVVRPMQSPALAYRAETEDLLLVRTSMKNFVFSPKRAEFPEIIKESMPPVVSRIFLMADGTKRLKDVFEIIDSCPGNNLLEDTGFRVAIEFLTNSERQLIKFAARQEDLDDPLKPCNKTPRNLYHSDKWPHQSLSDDQPHIDFHLRGIQDARWEFDHIEPTLNHSFRYPSEPLGGYDYGSRFCLFALRPEILASLGKSSQLSVLEVGGGTGTFAQSFIGQAARLKALNSNGLSFSYHILELSPTLAEHQKRLLAEDGMAVTHFQQDATEFSVPGHKFDLIIANE